MQDALNGILFDLAKATDKNFRVFIKLAGCFLNKSDRVGPLDNGLHYVCMLLNVVLNTAFVAAFLLVIPPSERHIVVGTPQDISN